MCTCINLKEGAIAVLGDSNDCKIKDIGHVVDLYIQYGNQGIKPIQIQIDKEGWKANPNEIDFIRLLQETETTAKLYWYDKEPIKLIELYPVSDSE